MILYYLVAVANGFLNTINKMVNVKAGECLGATRGALINYVEASVISFCLIYVIGNGAEMNFAHIKEVPVLFYMGSIFGLLASILLIIATKKSGAMASTVLMLLGQLSASMVLDYTFFGKFHVMQIVGIFLIISGIAWKEKLTVRSEEVTS